MTEWISRCVPSQQSECHRYQRPAVILIGCAVALVNIWYVWCDPWSALGRSPRREKNKKPAGANTSLKFFHTVFVSHLIATPQLLYHLRENVSIIRLWVMDTSSEFFLRACIIVYSHTLVCVIPSGVARQKAAPHTWPLNDDIHLHSWNPSISPSCIQFEPVDRISDPISTGKYSLQLKI